MTIDMALAAGQPFPVHGKERLENDNEQNYGP